MHERRNIERHRTLLGGKIVFNDRRSVIDCLIRNLSDIGACLQVNSTVGIPSAFHLLVEGEEKSIPSRTVWTSENRIGISFAVAQSEAAAPQKHEAHPPQNASHGERQTVDLLRGKMLALRAALDEVPLGIVLLDADTRAQFINRAFRRMWRLPDDDSKPPFVALVYHGRDTLAYAIPHGDLDAYVRDRVALVKAGSTKPIDIRLANGEVVRFQCTVLPAGGRMLCYTYVTDIVSHSDELEMLRAALDSVQQGVILLDPFLNAQFMNRAVRRLWSVSDEQADRKPPYAELVSDTRRTGAYAVPADELEKFIANRIALARAGDPTPFDIPHSDGRIIRSQCAILPGGGRMLTYTDVTDLVRRAKLFEELSTIDSMTGLFNRRQFDAAAEAEWSRFQRYHRPCSLLSIDIDHFKQINDKYGHETGDRAITHVAKICGEDMRNSDVLARLGGDEFAVLLPETDLEQACSVAERLRENVAERPLIGEESHESIPLTISIGIATASLSMPSFAALMKLADKSLYHAKSAGGNSTSRSIQERPADYRTAAE